MGLEVAPFINSFNPLWPLITDPMRQGDDHFRMIKAAIKASFPGITGAMTKTHTQLNAIPTNTPAVVTELLKHVVPKGVIAIWSGSIASIPVGWHICDGSNVAGFGIVPNLLDRFVRGAGNTYDPNDTGGAGTDVSTAAGGHTPVINDTVLNNAQMPDHAHFVLTTAEDFAGGIVTAANSIARQSHAGGDEEYQLHSSALVPTVGRTSGSGEGDPHTHTAVAVASHTHTVDTVPPFYALAYIIKVTAYIAPP